MKNIASQQQIHKVKQNKRIIIIRMMNFINGWKRKIDKVKKRRLYRYGKNVQSSLNLTVKEQYCVNDTPDQTYVTTEYVLDDNIAIENQVKLVAFKAVGNRSSRRLDDSCTELKSTNTTRNFQLNVYDNKYDEGYKRHYCSSFRSKDKQKYNRDIRLEGEDNQPPPPPPRIKKPLKRINSHSEEYGHIYKKINWQDWTMSPETTKHYNTYNYKKPNSDAPSILIEEVCFQTAADDIFQSGHSEMTFERLSRMYLDFDFDDFSTRSASSDDQENKENTNERLIELKVPDRNSSDSNKTPFIFPDSFQGSLKSFDESHRGSLQSRTSISSYSNQRRSSPVPMNFIPGQTKPMTRRERFASVPFNDIQKATFCFKGITCQVDRSKPRTSKAIVHMGMMVISILGPTAHKCDH